MNDARRGSLWVVGTGISLIGQTTIEALECMRAAGKLFYVTTNTAAESWIRELNPTATTLEDCYAEGKPRHETYEEMATRILEPVRQGFEVCAAFYGHPGVFVQPSHEAVRRARNEGFFARMLPGISAEDCLFADLGVDPGRDGCQSFEATDFLASRRQFDPRSGLVLWQVGGLGEPSIRRGHPCRPERLRVLADTLKMHYPNEHPIILYEAAEFAICDPLIKRISLDQLEHQQVFTTTTLFIPPRPVEAQDPAITRWFRES